MNLGEIMEEIADVLRELTNLQVFAHPPEKINPPGGAVSYPDTILYGQTYGGPRGAVKLQGLPIVLLSNRVTSESARDRASKWAATSGPQSIPERLEAHTWTSCDDLTVTECTFDVVTVGSVDYLAVMFKAEIIVSGG